MPSRRRSVIAGVMGVSAGLVPYLPSVICPGAACTSCFACVGAAGAAVSAVVAGLVTRRIGARQGEGERTREETADPADEAG